MYRFLWRALNRAIKPLTSDIQVSCALGYCIWVWWFEGAYRAIEQVHGLLSAIEWLALFVILPPLIGWLCSLLPFVVLLAIFVFLESQVGAEGQS